MKRAASIAIILVLAVHIFFIGRCTAPTKRVYIPVTDYVVRDIKPYRAPSDHNAYTFESGCLYTFELLRLFDSSTNIHDNVAATAGASNLWYYITQAPDEEFAAWVVSKQFGIHDQHSSVRVKAAFENGHNLTGE